MAINGVWLGEERECEDACLLMGEGGGVGENVVNGGPFALILVCTGFETEGLVGEDAVLREKHELRRIGFGIEIAHDDKVGVQARCTHGIGV